MSRRTSRVALTTPTISREETGENDLLTDTGWWQPKNARAATSLMMTARGFGAEAFVRGEVAAGEKIRNAHRREVLEGDEVAGDGQRIDDSAVAKEADRIADDQVASERRRVGWPNRLDAGSDRSRSCIRRKAEPESLKKRRTSAATTRSGRYPASTGQAGRCRLVARRPEPINSTVENRDIPEYTSARKTTRFPPAMSGGAPARPQTG